MSKLAPPISRSTPAASAPARRQRRRIAIAGHVGGVDPEPGREGVDVPHEVGPAAIVAVQQHKRGAVAPGAPGHLAVVAPGDDGLGAGGQSVDGIGVHHVMHAAVLSLCHTSAWDG